MNYARPELRDRLASEYVLGTLHGRARRRFQTLMAQDPALREAVAFWEREFVPLASPLSGAAPTAKVWAGIQSRIAPASAQAARQPGWFERWFGIRALGTAVAGLFVGVALTVLVPQLMGLDPDRSSNQLPESYAGFLQDGNGLQSMLISSRRHGRVVDIKVTRPVPVAADQRLELWALPKDGAPMFLGLVPAQGKGRIELPAPAESLLAKVTELAVSSAPIAAPPSDKPAGPFILRGPCAKFW